MSLLITSLDLPWGEFKTIYNDKNLSGQYIETTKQYFLVALLAGFDLRCVLQKTSPANSDQIDFENNYKNEFKTVGIHVITLQKEISETFDINVQNTGSSSLTVDGETTPVIFSLDADANVDLFITSIKFYGGDNNLQFGQFLGGSSPLTNGIEIKIKSNDNIRTLPLIKTTEDIKDKFAHPISEFRIDIQAGQDGIVGCKDFTNPFVIKKQGFFSTDDYIQVKIQDDLSGVEYLEMMVGGYKEEL